MKKSISLTVITLLLAVSSLSAATHYVSLESTNPSPPYTNWATAATNIQQAVVAAAAGDEVVVTNGVYDVGQTEVVGWGASRVAITNAISLRSVNGPQFTKIDGGGVSQYLRCVSLTEGASLTGFTLTNGKTYGNGGGVWCASTNAFLTNCVIVGNSAYGGGGGACGGTLYNCTLTANRASSGGGTYGSTLYNCTLADNWCWGSCQVAPYCPAPGGGARNSTLYNCTLTGNWATEGGGAFDCTLYNCIVTQNSAFLGGGACGGTLYNCTLSSNWADFIPLGGGPGAGGGAYGGTLYNCTLTGNSAGFSGGARQSTLYNCTLTGNSAAYNGGGAAGGTLYNCIVYFNTASADANYDSSSTLNYCCTTPLPTNGVGNITNAPLFVGYDGGDLRLRSDSPCIDAGTNLTELLPTDLLGFPRVMDGDSDGIARVDIGAYEFAPPAELVQRLIELVNESGLRHQRPLLATLEAALASIERGNTVSAFNQLHAFQNNVRAQIAPSDSALAQTLIQAAQEVIDALQAGGLLAEKLYGLKQQPDGKVQLRLSGPAGRVHLVEASTNLVHWELIGVAVDHGDGTFTFEDPNAANFPNRFYRVVAP